jgi:hypothetical protein
MTKQNPHAKTHTRAILLAMMAVTNVVSFVVGVSAAGHIAINRSSTPVAVETRSPTAPARAKAARSPAKAKTVPHPAKPAAHPLAAAATAGVRAGQTVVPTSLPIAGKGMWIYEFDKVGKGDARSIVNAAVQRGLTHLYVRAGSSVAGLSGWPNIARILPLAHRAGLKVIAWDFPYLRNPGADVRRAKWILRQSVHGHQVDGFAADVETRSEGTVLTRKTASRYASWLRTNARGKFLVLVPPRPNHYTTSFYPYDILVPKFDAVAPMVYWGRQAPSEATARAVGYLRRFGKPIAPIGQSFDMGPEGGPKGHPTGRALVHFMNEARRGGAVGVSFWSWQHTPRGLWHTIDTYHWPLRTGRS